jgi:hypothetical protein
MAFCPLGLNSTDRLQYFTVFSYEKQGFSVCWQAKKENICRAERGESVEQQPNPSAGSCWQLKSGMP